MAACDRSWRIHPKREDRVHLRFIAGNQIRTMNETLSVKQ